MRVPSGVLVLLSPQGSFSRLVGEVVHAVVPCGAEVVELMVERDVVIGQRQLLSLDVEGRTFVGGNLVDTV